MTAPGQSGSTFAIVLALTVLYAGTLSAAEPERCQVIRVSKGLQGTARQVEIVATAALPASRGETSGERARKLLALNREKLALGGVEDEFAPVAVSEAPGGSHVRFSHLHRGIEVHRGEVVVSMNRLGALTMVADAHVPKILLDRIDPEISAAEALACASRALGASSRPIGAPDSAALVIARTDGATDRLAYRVWMTRERPYGDWEVLVDAITGAIVSVEDRFVQYSDGDHVRGQGMTYLSDPLSAARALYGSIGFVDGDDADTDSLRAYRAQVALDSLVLEGGMAWLRGPYCRVTDIEAPYDPEGYGEPPPFRFDYDRSHPGFEAVMVYYHATQALLRLESLGFFLPRLRSLRLDPHGFQGKDNSHYSPSGNWISFGTGGVDDAEDADVIWHEYAHAIHYTIVQSWGGGECAALGEGYGDYWAASYARSLGQWRPDDPEYWWTFKWDGHNEFWDGRILDDDRSYPFDGLSAHMAGQVWASTLLEVHERLGRHITDRLVLKSIFYLTNGITARDAAYALLQADRDLYEGVHLNVLRSILGDERGFLAPESGSTILVLSDDAPDSNAANGVSSPGSRARGLVGSLTVPAGYALRFEEWTSFEPRLLLDAALTVVLSGSNRDPLNDTDKRRQIVDFVRAGGNVLVEGASVAAHMLAADVEPVFAHEVLAAESLVGPLECTLLFSTEGRLFTLPSELPSVLSVVHDPDTDVRYGVEPLSEIPDVSAAGLWDGMQDAAAIVTRQGTGNTLRSVFFSFDVSSIGDSACGTTLLQNAILGLLANVTSTAVEGSGETSPVVARLAQNYPNPFNPVTRIRFTLAEPAEAILRVYDVLGREVSLLLNERLQGGTHEVEWNGAGMPSGMYLCQLTVGGNVQTRRMLLLR